MPEHRLNENWKTKMKSQKARKRPSRASSSTGAACSKVGMFPKQCMIGSKERIKVGGKFQFPTKILTKSAEETLKNAANLRNDQKMITAATGIDLIAKEFSKHQICYVNYTRITRETKKNSASSERDITGDFQSVCNVIEKLVLGQQKCVPMETIVSAYGINEGDKQQRYRLKQRLFNEYTEQLLFISYEKHSPQLVISKDCLEKQNLTNILETSRCNTVKRVAAILPEDVTNVSMKHRHYHGPQP